MSAAGPRERTLRLHIGLPKTASTWLQAQVFPALRHLRVVATPRARLFDEPEDGPFEGRVMAGLLRRAPPVWRDLGDVVLSGMLGAREDWLAQARDLLLSEEAIGRAGSRPGHLAEHLREIAALAARWGMGRLQVVCLVRRQDHWLASHYAQMSDRNPRASQRDFEAFVDRVMDPAASRYALGMMLDYAALREALAGAATELVVMPYEALARDRAAALRGLLGALGTPRGDWARIEAASLGITANVRSQAGAWRLRPPSLPLPGRGRIALPGPARLWARGAIALTPRIEAGIAQAYGPSNRALEAALPLGLGSLGYPGLGGC